MALLLVIHNKVKKGRSNLTFLTFTALIPFLVYKYNDLVGESLEEICRMTTKEILKHEFEAFMDDSNSDEKTRAQAAKNANDGFKGKDGEGTGTPSTGLVEILRIMGRTFGGDDQLLNTTQTQLDKEVVQTTKNYPLKMK